MVDDASGRSWSMTVASRTPMHRLVGDNFEKRKRMWKRVNDGMSELLPLADRASVDDSYGVVVTGQIWGRWRWCQR